MNYLKKAMIKHKSKVTRVFEELCKNHNLDFVIEDSDKGYFIDNKGNKHNFDYGTIDLNREENVDISDDKEKSSEIIRKLKLNVPNEIFIREVSNVEDVISRISNFIKNISFPVIIKPINGRQGDNIFKIDNDKELKKVINYFINNNIKFLIQEYLNLPEIRVVMLDGKLLQAYKRFRPKIVGDGINSINFLIDQKNKKFKINNRNTIINKEDKQIKTIINKIGYDLNSVPTEKEIINLSYGRNLSKGGEYEFVEDKLKPEFLENLKNISEDIGLRLVGFDLFLKKGVEDACKTEDFVIIEYNGSPDMENNFYFDNEYEDRFKNIYKNIFEAIIE